LGGKITSSKLPQSAELYFEAMLENHQKLHGLENLNEGGLNQNKGAVKFLGRAEHGKAMKMELETAKSRNFAGLSSISPRVLGCVWTGKYFYHDIPNCNLDDHQIIMIFHA